MKILSLILVINVHHVAATPIPGFGLRMFPIIPPRMRALPLLPYPSGRLLPRLISRPISLRPPMILPSSPLRIPPVISSPVIIHSRPQQRLQVFTRAGHQQIMSDLNRAGIVRGLHPNPNQGYYIRSGSGQGAGYEAGTNVVYASPAYDVYIVPRLQRSRHAISGGSTVSSGGRQPVSTNSGSSQLSVGGAAAGTHSLRRSISNAAMSYPQPSGSNTRVIYQSAGRIIPNDPYRTVVGSSSDSLYQPASSSSTASLNRITGGSNTETLYQPVGPSNTAITYQAISPSNRVPEYQQSSGLNPGGTGGSTAEAQYQSHKSSLNAGGVAGSNAAAAHQPPGGSDTSGVYLQTGSSNTIILPQLAAYEPASGAGKATASQAGGGLSGTEPYVPAVPTESISSGSGHATGTIDPAERHLYRKGTAVPNYTYDQNLNAEIYFNNTQPSGEPGIGSGTAGAQPEGMTISLQILGPSGSKISVIGSNAAGVAESGRNPMSQGKLTSTVR